MLVGHTALNDDTDFKEFNSLQRFSNTKKKSFYFIDKKHFGLGFEPVTQKNI